MSNHSSEIVNEWTGTAQKLLVGRKIVNVRYLNEQEVEHMGWYSSTVVIELDNGLLIWPSRDDEGNDAGALFTTDPEVMTLPVI